MMVTWVMVGWGGGCGAFWDDELRKCVQSRPNCQNAQAPIYSLQPFPPPPPRAAPSYLKLSALPTSPHGDIVTSVEKEKRREAREL